MEMKKTAFILFLSIMKISLEEKCGVDPATKPSECFTLDDKMACCLAKPELGNSFCYLFKLKDIEIEIKNQPFVKEINGENHSVRCEIIPNFGAGLEPLGYPCGPQVPKDYKDCTAFTKDNNPCCLYNNTITKLARCFKIGKITLSSLITYDNLLINCNAAYSSLSISIILFFLFL